MLILARKFEVKAFEDISLMNVIVDAFKQRIRGIVPPSVLKVVDFLASHSCKVRGVSWATYDYMKDKTGLSLSTLKRVVKLLASFGFIQVIRTWVGGRQSANIIQIQKDIDWQEVQAKVMERVRFAYADEQQPETDVVSEETGAIFSPAADTVQDTGEDMPADTLSTEKVESESAENPYDNEIFWDVPEYIPAAEAFSCLSNSFNKDKYIKKGIAPLFFNWLEE